MKITENYWAMQARFWLNRRWKANRRAAATTILRFRTLVRALPRGSLMVDCGANVGDVTGIFLESGHRVIAFEPDPDAFAILSERYSSNPSVTLRNEAVGAFERKLRLHRAPKVRAGEIALTQGTSLFAHADVDDSEGLEVDVIDLPAFLLSLEEPVAIPKLDIEGAEVEIVEALLAKGHTHIHHVLVETHERMFPDLAGRIAALRARTKEDGLSKFDLDWV